MSDRSILYSDDFSKTLERNFSVVLMGARRIGVAVSGGADSMALAVLLARWAAGRGAYVHVLTVDHGLREEAAAEALAVGTALSGFENIQHHILKWDAPSDVRVQEAARKARYALMAQHCAAHDISALFLAHHRDDQAETVLFRLAKGSGLDGLCGMREIHDYDEHLKICRPLLGFAKEDLIAVCVDADVPYIDDPSNDCDDFARVRLRQSRGVLEEEGLSPKRLSVTAMRLARARDALDQMAEKAYGDALLEKNTKQIVFNIKSLLEWPEEIILRVVMQGMQGIAPRGDYAARMERVEALVSDLIAEGAFRKRTLGGVIFSRDDKTGVITLAQE